MYLNDSGARWDALFNSRLVRGGAQEGGTKTQRTSSLCQAGRPIVENSWRAAKLESYLRWAPEVQVETWVCRVVTSRWAVSETAVLAGRREVTVHMMPSAGRSPESPGPGEDYRRLQGWTPLLRTPNSGVWVCRGALRGNQLLAALVSSVDWVVRGTYRTAWAVLFASKVMTESMVAPSATSSR